MFDGLNKFVEALVRHAYKAEPVGAHITRFDMYRRLAGVFAELDSPTKRTLVISGSEFLASHAGLNNTQIISIGHPEYSIDNLAFLSNSFDFVITDQVISHYRDLGDVCAETIRVLKPGGRFLHTSCFINFTRDSPPDYWRATLPALQEMFPFADDVVAEGWGNRTATILMESEFRFLPVPIDPENPIYQIATTFEPDWPITVWVRGRKAETADELLPTVSTRRANPKRYTRKANTARFGIVACARNEAPYLLEWIAYHRMIGFDSITIYDNESNDASEDILKPLSEAGIINAIYWPSLAGQNKQVSAYNHAVLNFCDEVEWCGFFDIDEFLLLDAGTTLEALVNQFDGANAIGIPWRFFGSSNYTFRTTELVTERFTRAAPENNEHIKSLVRLSEVYYMNVHVPTLKSGKFVDVSGNIIEENCLGKLATPSQGSARLHHYFCKSVEEFECKRARGRGAVAPEEPDQIRPRSIFSELDYNDVEDNSMLAFTADLKREIAKLKQLVK